MANLFTRHSSARRIKVMKRNSHGVILHRRLDSDVVVSAGFCLRQKIDNVENSPESKGKRWKKLVSSRRKNVSLKM
jgi:hypothetical protein